MLYSSAYYYLHSKAYFFLEALLLLIIKIPIFLKKSIIDLYRGVWLVIVVEVGVDGKRNA
ncbi:hypothetical protein P029_03400 [Anaplasma phagocytophilum str. Norway variant2]|uniref:Uncharacterized protein n=1 Tax=Anaplasma phagocytophilum str. Norway variant2 TaxID=1392507 RepID=A0A161I610_ANAPH|nr:hypothetical protein P029_03400 [Anaplasma phagocytophilum str. Norway variant2]